MSYGVEASQSASLRLTISKSKLNIQCLTNTSQVTQVVSLQWYDGKHGLPQPESPTLVICYDNGRLQMMVNESDESEYGFQESVCLPVERISRLKGVILAWDSV